MTRSMTVARISGVDVRLHPTFALVFLWALIDWRHIGAGHSLSSVVFTLVLVLLVFACVLLHELGHVLMARHHGVRVHDVSLSAVGGIARMEQLPVAPRAEALIALAGPAANLALVTALLPLALLIGILTGFSSAEDYLLAVFQPSVAGLVTTLLYANILIVASNLLPAFPMDGGRIFRAGLATIWGRESATRAAVVVGELLALLLLLVGIFVVQSVIIAILAIFIMVVAYAEDQAVRVDSALRRMRVGQFALWDMGGISSDQPLAYALRGGPRDMAVTRDGKVVGMLWRNRVLQELGMARSGVSVGDVMEESVPIVDVDTSIHDVQRMMSEQELWAVAVTEDGFYRGIFTGDRFVHIYRQLCPDPLSSVRQFLKQGLMERLGA